MATDNTTAPNVVNLFTKTPYEPLTPSTTTPATPATPEKSGRDTKRRRPYRSAPDTPTHHRGNLSTLGARRASARLDRRALWRGQAHLATLGAARHTCRAQCGRGSGLRPGRICRSRSRVGRLGFLPWRAMRPGRHGLLGWRGPRPPVHVCLAARAVAQYPKPREERAWRQQEVRMLHAKRDHTLALGQIKAIIYVMMQLMISTVNRKIN